jgi:hypothetical protein
VAGHFIDSRVKDKQSAGEQSCIVLQVDSSLSDVLRIQGIGKPTALSTVIVSQLLLFGHCKASH